ncbi:hypothetical protein E4U31_003886 [Claviceps sp. LM219 group G6]|nr:hypothetical protein E4U31_003886 [Claviceps sp. LM219 group G6]
MIDMVIVLLSNVFLAAVYAWHRAYPRPYKDIPYSTQSARRLLGDIPDIIQFVRDGNAPEDFIADRCRRLNSPIIQLFFEPFSRPLIFLDDAAAVSNIVCTRTKELDRAPITVRTFLHFFPRSSILKQTTPEWRAQRRLWKDSMGQDFLHHIAAPKTYKVALQLMELFQLKTSMGNGRPFSVDTDFNLFALDAVWAAFLGSDLHGVRDELDGLRNQHDDFCFQQPASVDSPAALPPTVKGELFRAIEYLNSTMNVSVTSPLSGWYRWFVRQRPKFRRYWALKTKIINEHIRKARERFAYSGSQQVDGSKMCAVDIVLCREQSAISRPNPSAFVIPPTDEEIHDELFMTLVAGHETTATALSWSVKLLTNNAESQKRLRDALRTALPQTNVPTLDDILNTDIPYLDATLEECIRLANIMPRIVRVARQNTEILGIYIPKGAQIMCTTFVCGHSLGGSPTYGARNIRQDEKICESSKPGHSTDDLHIFSPERWLDDVGVFNPQALPKLAFSGGPRVCFGRKFAMQELRILLVVLLMKLRLESVPDELNSMQSQPMTLRVPRQTFVRLANLDSFEVT